MMFTCANTKTGYFKNPIIFTYSQHIVLALLDIPASGGLMVR